MDTLIENLLVNGPSGPSVDPFAAAFQLASQPNYLGSPVVVSGIVQQIIDAAVGYFNGKGDFNGVWDMIWTLSNEIATGDGYTRIPEWHVPDQIGKALVRYLNVLHIDLFKDDLEYFLSEALMAVFFKTRDLLVGFASDLSEDREARLGMQLQALHDWAVSVFLGTNVVLSPDMTLADFGWGVDRPTAG